MSIPVTTDLDFGTGFQLIGALIDNRGSDPATHKTGQFWIRGGVVYYSSDGTNPGIKALSVGGGVVATVSSGNTGITVGGTATDPILTLNPASGTVAGSMSTAHFNLVNAATSANTSSALVQRDVNGDFSARNITATTFIGALTGTASNASQLNSQSAAYYLSRTNHTGTQTASTISDFNTAVRTNRLDQMAAPTAAVSMGSQLLQSLATPVSGTDAANKNYVDSVAQGLDVKASVRVATTANGALATAFANGQTVDGIALVTGDRILLKNQSAPAENGIYTVNGSGAPTRALDADAWTELPGAFVFVEIGTANAGTGWACNVAQGGTLGTTAITFVQFSGAGTFSCSNLGTGSNLFAQMSGNVAQFRSLTATSTKITLVQNTNDVGIDVNPANIEIDALAATAKLSVAKGGTGLASTSQNFVFAGPTGSAGAPTWRLLVAGDIPNLDFAKITTGIVPKSQGGTGLNLTNIQDFPGAVRIPARVVMTTNTSIAAPGATLDGVAMAAGDRVLLVGQSTGSQNGLWIWNSAAGAMTRPLDYPAAGTVQAFYGIEVDILAGTLGARTEYVLTTTGAITIDTTATVWTLQPEIRKYATTIGDGSTLTYNITHSLNSTDVTVNCWETGGSKRQLPFTQIQIIDANTVQLVFGTGAAPAASAVRVVVVG